MPGYGGGNWGNGGLGGSDPALAVWNYATAVEQQRVQPVGFTPFEATLPFSYTLSPWKFVLGNDLAGRKWRARAGDYVELAQTADWAANVLRAIVQVRPPVQAQAGVSWVLSVLMDGVLWDSFTFAPGSPERTLWALGVRGGGIGPTPHTWSFRLTLATTSTPAPAAMAAPHPNPQVTLTITSAASLAPLLPIIVTTSVPHGLHSLDVVHVTGVVGNTAANGYWPVTVIDATHFSLNGSVSNGTYLSGGTAVAPPNVPVLVSQASTTVAVGSNGTALSSFAGAGVLNVATTAGFQSAGQLIFTNHGNAVVSYTGTSGGNQFTGCKLVSGSGNLATNDPVISNLNEVDEVELPGVYVSFVFGDNA